MFKTHNPAKVDLGCARVPITLSSVLTSVTLSCWRAALISAATETERVLALPGLGPMRGPGLYGLGLRQSGATLPVLMVEFEERAVVSEAAADPVVWGWTLACAGAQGCACGVRVRCCDFLWPL